MSDHGRELLVDRLLAHIEKNGSDGTLREMAAGIRRGDGSLRDFLASSSYYRALQPGLQDFSQRYDRLSDSERAGEAQRCQRHLDQLGRQERTSAHPDET